MFWRVTFPVCLLTIFDVSIYLFVNAMTTVSGVIFLYSYDTTLASVSSIHLSERGDVSAAAAMAMQIVYVSVFVRIIHLVITKGVLRRTQAWRTRSLASPWRGRADRFFSIWLSWCRSSATAIYTC